MSPRKTARPHKDATARPGKSVRSSLIAKDKKKKRSAQDTSALDDRFDRTDRRSPAPIGTPNCTALAMQHLRVGVGCSVKLPRDCRDAIPALS